MRDYSDESVKGLERYIPSTLSKSLLGMMLISPWLAFPFFHSNSEWFLTISTPSQKMLLAILLSVSVSLGLSFALVLNLLVIIYQSKHRSISHNYYKPYGYLFLTLLAIFCFALGYCVALP